MIIYNLIMDDVEFLPGHHFELEKLGILKPDERYMSVDDLVTRTIEKDKTEQVLEIIKMEHAHYAQDLMNVDHTIERTRKSITAIQDLETFNNAEANVSLVDQILFNATDRSARLFEAVDGIRQRSPISSVVQEHIQTMKNNQDKIIEIFDQKGENLIKISNQFRTDLDDIRSKF